MTSFRIDDLPLVPSLNNAYGNKRYGFGRFAKPHVHAWKVHAGWLIQMEKPPKITGPYKLTVLVPLKMRGDVDNRVKLASDLLSKELKIIPNDSLAVETTCRRDASIADGRCTIVVEAVL